MLLSVFWGLSGIDGEGMEKIFVDGVNWQGKVWEWACGTGVGEAFCQPVCILKPQPDRNVDSLPCFC